MNTPFGRMEKIGKIKESWTEDQKIAATEYLALTNEDRQKRLQAIKERLGLAGHGTRSPSAKADSMKINSLIGFPISSSKETKLAGFQDIIVYKDIGQIEEAIRSEDKKAA